MILQNKNSNLIIGLLLCYGLFLFICCFFNTPFRDTLYYWDWSRHLALSYYDGPPLIAYAIRSFTNIFGDNVFAFNFLALCLSAITAVYLYKIATELCDEACGRLAAGLWFLMPFVNQQLIGKLTYDNLLNLFWFASLYYVIRYQKYQKPADCYFFAMTVGLMLLSKYTGLVLLLALLIYFAANRLARNVFKSKHFYMALIVIIFILSPVLIWNAQHNWLSFRYQLSVHKTSVLGYFNGKVVYFQDSTSLSQRLLHPFQYMLSIAQNFHILLLISLWGLYRMDWRDNNGFRLVFWLSAIFVVFWLTCSFFANIASNYTLPLLGMMSLFASYALVKRRVQTYAISIMVIFLIADICVSISHIKGSAWNTRELSYQVVQKVSPIYSPDVPIIVPHYVAAEQISYWLPGKPQAYSLACGLGANQYKYWGQDFELKLQQHQIKQALFLDYINEPFCIVPYFKYCAPAIIYTVKKTLPLTHKIETANLYAFRCNN